MLARSLLTEFIGTFFLVLTIGLAVKGGPVGAETHPLAAIGIGSALMVMIYMGGHISGAHYNPAVSTAAMLRGKLDLGAYVPYMLIQVAGAIIASLAVYWVLGETLAPTPAAGITASRALLLEFLFTFALALVVLNAATAPKTAGNSFYGLAIGFTVAAGAIAAGRISGGAFNPAVGIGLTVVHATLGNGSFRDLWIYLVGPFAGGIVAAYVFMFQNNVSKSDK